jgi:hypothetical protein
MFNRIYAMCSNTPDPPSSLDRSWPTEISLDGGQSSLFVYLRYILFYGKHLSHKPTLVISDVGAYFLKPLFVIGTIITSLTFVATLAALLYLQAPQKKRQKELFELSSPTQNAVVGTPEVQTRLPAHGRTSERVLAIMALVGALIGGAGLILLSGFDTSRYPILHRVFLTVFMFGVALSALLTMVQVSTS